MCRRYTGDHVNASAPLSRCFGNSETHPARRSIRDKTNRIDCFASCARGNHNCFVCQIAPCARRLVYASVCQNLDRPRYDLFGLAQSSRTDRAARHLTFVRSNYDDAISFELFDVSASGGMLPHHGIHGRRDHYWRSASEICRGDEIISHAIGEFRQRIGSGRCNQEQIYRLGKRYVRDGIGVVDSVIINQHVRSRQRTERKRLNEFAGMARHCNAYFTAVTLQTAEHLDAFICGYPTGDTEGYSKWAISIIRPWHLKLKCNIAELGVQ